MQKTITLIIEEACLCSDIDEVGSLVQIDCRDSHVQDGKGYKDG